MTINGRLALTFEMSEICRPKFIVRHSTKWFEVLDGVIGNLKQKHVAQK
jgi:hypothetical protein